MPPPGGAEICSSQKDEGHWVPGLSFSQNNRDWPCLCREDGKWYQRMKLIHGPWRGGNRSLRDTQDKSRLLDWGPDIAPVWATAPTSRNQTRWVRTCPPAKLIASCPNQGPAPGRSIALYLQQLLPRLPVRTTLQFRLKEHGHGKVGFLGTPQGLPLSPEVHDEGPHAYRCTGHGGLHGGKG